MGVNELLNIGQTIKILRLQTGISAKDFSQKIGIPYSTYSNYENNNREPDAKTLNLICDQLNVQVSDFLSYARRNLHEDTKIFFGMTISELRKQQELDFIDVAKALGVDRSGLKRLEYGIDLPDLKTLVKASRLFKVNISYLIGWESADRSEEFNPKFQDRISFGISDYSESELKEICEFAEFVKFKRGDFFSPFPRQRSSGADRSPDNNQDNNQDNE